MVTIISAAQSLGSGIITALGAISGLLTSVLTSTTSPSLSTGASGSTALPSIPPLGSLSGLASWGIPPVEILQPLLSTLGGLLEWAAMASMPIATVLLSLAVVLATLLPMFAGVFIGVIAAIVVGWIVAFLEGFVTGIIGFIITPMLMGLTALPIGFLVGTAVGMVVAVAIFMLELVIALPVLGTSLSPIMSLGNTVPAYFLNLLYLGIIGPPIALAFSVIFILLVAVLPIAALALLIGITNIPLWGFFVGDVFIVTPLSLLVMVILGLAEIFIAAPLAIAATLITLTLLEAPILGSGSLSAGVNSLVPGPSSIGSSGGTASAFPTDTLLGSLGSGAVTTTATATGVGATGLTAGSLTAAFAALGLAGGALAIMATGAAGLLAAVSRLPAAAITPASALMQALSTTAATLTGATNMLIDTTGNRAIHDAVGLLQ